MRLLRFFCGHVILTVLPILPTLRNYEKTQMNRCSSCNSFKTQQIMASKVFAYFSQIAFIIKFCYNIPFKIYVYLFSWNMYYKVMNVMFYTCLSFCSRGCLPQCMLGYHPPGKHTPRKHTLWEAHPQEAYSHPQKHPPGNTPPESTHPPGKHTPPGKHPPWKHTPWEAAPPRWLPLRTVRILLECILVVYFAAYFIFLFLNTYTKLALLSFCTTLW